METLKMKFKLHGLEFELEGNEATVKKEFENFKAFTVDLLSKTNIIVPQIAAVPEKINKQLGQTQDIDPIEFTEYPVIKEVVRKDLPKTETDWILVYAFYSTNFGETNFTEKDIKSQYVTTGRKNDSRMKNLTHNINSLLKQDFIKVHNDTEYLIKEKGLNYTKQILQGKSVSKSVKRLPTKSKSIVETDKSEHPDKGSKVKKAKATKASGIGFIDLKLTPAEQKSLNEYFTEKQPKTQNEKVITVMKWYIDDKKVDEVSMEEMNYLLSIAAETPSALAQVLGNMVGSGFRWVTKGDKGKYKLSSIGENYVVNKLPKQ